MKNKIIQTVIVVMGVILTISTTSCVTKKKIVHERNDSYIADLDAFGVETFHLYASSSNIGKVKVSDFYVTFAPRTNYVLVTGRVGINTIRISFSYEERQSLLKAHDAYIAAFESSSLRDVKPTKKNAFTTGTAYVEWGAAGLGHEVETTYFTNTQFLEENKPYFLIQFNQTEEKISEVYSPKLFIYISPSQWEKIIEACNQEHLISMTDKIVEEAEAF